jgi:hypothetical protein
MPHHDASLLRAALVGYHPELARVNAAIAALQQRLHKRGSTGNTTAPATKAAPARRKRSRISPEGLRRIRQAQLRRWATARKAQSARKAATPAPAKRRAAQKRAASKNRTAQSATQARRETPAKSASEPRQTTAAVNTAPAAQAPVPE